MALLSLLMLIVGFRNSLQCLVQVRWCVRSAVQDPGTVPVLDVHLDVRCSETLLHASNAAKRRIYTQCNATHGLPISLPPPGFRCLAVVNGGHAIERVLMLDQTANDRLCQDVGAVPIAVPIGTRPLAVNDAPIAANHFGKTVRVTKTCDDLESLGLNSFRSGGRTMRDPLDGVGRDLHGCRVREGQQQEFRVVVPSPASHLQMAVEHRLRWRLRDIHEVAKNVILRWERQQGFHLLRSAQEWKGDEKTELMDVPSLASGKIVFSATRTLPGFKKSEPDLLRQKCVVVVQIEQSIFPCGVLPGDHMSGQFPVFVRRSPCFETCHPGSCHGEKMIFGAGIPARMDLRNIDASVALCRSIQVVRPFRSRIARIRGAVILDASPTIGRIPVAGQLFRQNSCLLGIFRIACRAEHVDKCPLARPRSVFLSKDPHLLQ